MDDGLDLGEHRCGLAVPTYGEYGCPPGELAESALLTLLQAVRRRLARLCPLAPP
jgi:hypothetical protein